MKTVDDYPAYQKIDISGVPVYVFESHNMALPIWGHYSTKLGKLNLLTFDMHTDIHDPIEIPSPTSLYEYSEMIRNDMQIRAAYHKGFLQSYTIVARIDSENFRDYEMSDRHEGYRATYISAPEFEQEMKMGHACVNACEVLDEQNIDYPLKYMQNYWKKMTDAKMPLALDFDLDFFLNEETFSVDFERFVEPFVLKASVITIAQEPNFCEWDSERAEEKLLEMISTIKQRKVV